MALTLAQDEVIGIIGESGSGKTVLSRALVNWVREPLRVVSGSLLYRGREFVGHGGQVSRLGQSAVLRFSALDVLVCHTIVAPGDPQLYRGFGIEPLMYDLVVVKANTSFRASYANIAGEIHEADTPGAAAADLLRLPTRERGSRGWSPTIRS